MDLFMETGRDLPDSKGISPENITRIETYLSNYDGWVKKQQLWVSANMFEMLAIIVAEKCFVDSLSSGGKGDVETSLGEHMTMRELYELVKDSASKILWEVYELNRFTEADIMNEYIGGSTKYEIEKKYHTWNEELFMPLCMKYLFPFIAEDNINWDRYSFWESYPVGRLIAEEEPSIRTKIKDNEYSYMGIDLKSPGHRKLCSRLHDLGYMFFFEAPCKLVGDTKHYRRIDLVVIHGNRAVIVEVDGGTHRTKEVQKDDYERDRLIRKNWQNTLRLEHGEALYKTEECIEKIVSALDPTRGIIS